MTTNPLPCTRTEDHPPMMTTCLYCHAEFAARKPGTFFCKAAHRAAYQRETGLQGEVAGVSRLISGVKVVIHFPAGPAATKAIGLFKRQKVLLVKDPE